MLQSKSLPNLREEPKQSLVLPLLSLKKLNVVQERGPLAEFKQEKMMKRLSVLMDYSDANQASSIAGNAEVLQQ